MGASDTLPNIQISYSSNVSVEPNVSTYQFGDGYSQSIANGINYLPEMWSIQFVNRSNDEYYTLKNFFESMGGTDYFMWTPPPYKDAGGTPYPPRKFICRKWSRTPNSGTTNNISATFEETFNI